MSQHPIRGAEPSDAPELARLTAQLGFPSPEAAIGRRLALITGSPDACLLVAERPGGGLAGWIHGLLSRQLESDGRVEIGGPVVDETFRRRGIGRRLVRAVGVWAIERGAFELSVRCREERSDSHAFYESLAFRHARTQRVFRRTLVDAV